MPIYPGRRAGTWRVTVWARGKQLEEIVEGSRTDASNHEARLRIETRASGSTSQRTAKRFSNFLAEDYVPFAQQHLGADTWLKVRRYQVATLNEFFGSYTLVELSNGLVDEYKAHRSRDIIASSVNNELRVLKTMLRWAKEERGMLVADLRIRRLKQLGARRVHCWTSRDVERLLASVLATDPDLVPMLTFLLNTGCRKGEGIAAEWSWIDQRRRLLSIPVTEFWRPKSNRPREVPIGDVLWRNLAKLEHRSERWVFPNVFGERFKLFPNKRFSEAVKAAGLQGGPHTCRHTFASHFLQAVPDLHQLATILGHSQTRVTELYTHLLPGHLERARNAVNLGPAKTRAKNPGGTLAKKVAS